MIKYILFLLFLTSNLFSIDYLYQVIDKVETSRDFKNYKEISKTSLIHEQMKKISIKITLNTQATQQDNFYLTVVSDVDSLVYTNTSFTRNKNIIHIKLDDIEDTILYFDYIYDKSKQAEFRCDVITEFEYLYMYPFEGILYGLAYGILFCAFLYYLIIYFSTKVRSFLYYSIMQLFVLLSLIGFTYVSFLAYPNQGFYLTQAIIDICETSAFLFTLLFAKQILDTKTVMPKINHILNFFILLNLLDIIAILFYKHSILYEYMRFDIVFLIPTIAGLLAVYKGNKFASIYTMGWFLMFIFIYIAEEQIFSFSSIYTIHIAAPLESLIFSFALGVMLKDLVNKQNEKEKMLIHKSKLASMGEMINNIAHQWRQPLTHLGYINMNLQLASDDEQFDTKYLKEKIKESNHQIEFMSETIDNFRDFYKPSKEKEPFHISKAIQKSIDIMTPLLKLNTIEINFVIHQDTLLISYENQYSQVILNLISNAKDELISQNIKDPHITIELYQRKGKILTTITDNAGGIKKEFINKIFEPYFTTKEKGSGIGLYMSKTIIESHFKGSLSVQNNDDGACFTIRV